MNRRKPNCYFVRFPLPDRRLTDTFFFFLIIEMELGNVTFSADNMTFSNVRKCAWNFFNLFLYFLLRFETMG